MLTQTYTYVHMSIYCKHGNFHVAVYKIFNATLKFKGKNFVTKTVTIIIEKATYIRTYDNSMVRAVLLQISYHIAGFQQRWNTI